MTGRRTWNLWLGHGVPFWDPSRRCEVCGTRWLVFRYTNGEDAIWLCRAHRDIAPAGDGGAHGN